MLAGSPCVCTPSQDMGYRTHNKSINIITFTSFKTMSYSVAPMDVAAQHATQTIIQYGHTQWVERLVVSLQFRPSSNFIVFLHSTPLQIMLT